MPRILKGPFRFLGTCLLSSSVRWSEEHKDRNPEDVSQTRDLAPHCQTELDFGTDFPRTRQYKLVGIESDSQMFCLFTLLYYLWTVYIYQ